MVLMLELSLAMMGMIQRASNNILVTCGLLNYESEMDGNCEQVKPESVTATGPLAIYFTGGGQSHVEKDLMHAFSALDSGLKLKCKSVDLLSIHHHLPKLESETCEVSIVYQNSIAESEVKLGARSKIRLELVPPSRVPQNQLRIFGWTSRLLPRPLVINLELFRPCCVPQNQLQIFRSVPRPCHRPLVIKNLTV